MSVLTGPRIRKRLFEDRDLVVRPLIDTESQIEDGSINLTLGTQFIVAKKSEHPVVDPRDLDVDRAELFQTKITLAFGEALVLHPQQFALGVTFEFLKLPTTLSAFVLTRSSLGRAGLQIATAIHVHPGWQGCLTLELQNLGEVPIKLYCGSSIGQLVLQDADPPFDPRPLRSIPVSPVFTDLKNQAHWKYLKKFNNDIS